MKVKYLIYLIDKNNNDFEAKILAEMNSELN